MFFAKKISSVMIIFIGLVFGLGILANYELLDNTVEWSEDEGKYLKTLDFTDSRLMEDVGNNLVGNSLVHRFHGTLDVFVFYAEAATHFINGLMVVLDPLIDFTNVISSYVMEIINFLKDTAKVAKKFIIPWITFPDIPQWIPWF